MMNGLPLVLYLTLLLDSVLSSVLSSLPAPVNANVHSVNFHHVLRWEPGLGTPVGTQYKISWRVIGKEKKHPSYSNTTSFKLNIPDNTMRYILTVRASYNQTLSQESNRVKFYPMAQTIIGPPKVTLTGCGNCIHVNISLPEADRSSRIKDIKKFYHGSQFSVHWKTNKGAVESAITPNKTYTVKNLQIGTEYCVQVHTKINVNRNTKPSAWNCTFTSIVEPSREPVFLGAVAALLIAIVVLMSFMFCLSYTGFICKLKETLPRVLDVRHKVLGHGSTLTPERTIPYTISIDAEMEEQKRHHNHPAPQTATMCTDLYDEEEDEEGENVYMERDAELSSGESSCQDSVDVSGNSKVAVSRVSGRHGGLDQNEAKAEGTEVSFMPEGPVTDKVKEEEEEEEEVEKVEVVEVVEEEEEEEVVVVCENLGNINLFSVTLAALAVCEEEGGEQNRRESLTDFLEPLLPTKSKRTLNDTDSLTESGDRTAVALMSPTQEDFTECGYETRHIATSSGCLSSCDGETQEEKEEFSGYMGHT
ncbi:interferon alpha/beta receptor 1a-like [Cyclopterus lumpus]|uniref:interferon alpha/beta receptor 1a-like n=1 Tax=Cyclopterus lumpus TaxID=8103 RepID=UPI0014866ADC|nr:interferon alpha/beta receptor 1a-like [Cyclopterus lumpus]